MFIDFITQDEKDYKYGEILKRQGYDVAGLRSQDYNANFLPTENVKSIWESKFGQAFVGRVS